MPPFDSNPSSKSVFESHTDGSIWSLYATRCLKYVSYFFLPSCWLDNCFAVIKVLQYLAVYNVRTVGLLNVSEGLLENNTRLIILDWFINTVILIWAQKYALWDQLAGLLPHFQCRNYQRLGSPYVLFLEKYDRRLSLVCHVILEDNMVLTGKTHAHNKVTLWVGLEVWQFMQPDQASGLHSHSWARDHRSFQGTCTRSWVLWF